MLKDAIASKTATFSDATTRFMDMLEHRWMCMSNGDLGAKNAKRNHITEDCSTLHNASTWQIVTMSQLVKVKYRYLLQGTYFAFPNLVTIFSTTSTKKKTPGFRATRPPYRSISCKTNNFFKWHAYYLSFRATHPLHNNKTLPRLRSNSSTS